jgi:hypothetical protein
MVSGSGWMSSLARHSDTAALMVAHDWAATPLGPSESWPESLRAAVRLCLASDFPILVAWGPDLVMIYNEGYRQMLGSDKHPAAIGRPVREVWAEIWDDIRPLFDHVQQTGLSHNSKDLLLEVVRNGYVEEAYFTFCYSPIFDGSDIAGMLNIAIETTAEVVGARRLALISRLAAAVASARDVTEVCSAAVEAVTGAADVTAAEVQLWGEGTLLPVSSSAARAGSATDADELARVVGPEPIVLDPNWKPGAPARRVAMAVGSGDASGVMAFDVNPRRLFDEDHRSFVELLGRTVGAALDTAYRRSVELGEQQMISDTLQTAMLAPASDLPTVAARYRPASGQLSVGGDWYDVIALPDGRRALVVGDCVGHGLASAAAMGQLRSASRALLLEGRPPVEVLGAMDDFARSVPGGDCATMACAVIDLAQLRISYACAGHPPPLLVSGGIGSWLDGGRSGPLGYALGDRQQAEATISPGDLLVLYSDGLVERRSESIDDGLDRLRASAEIHAGAPVQSIADALLADLLEDHPGDDVVVVVKQVA